MNKIGSQILTIVEETNRQFKLYNESDRVVFAISGGKDSLSLLTLLSSYFSEVECVHIRVSPDSDLSFLDYTKNYADIEVVESEIMTEAKYSKKNPCFICSRRRNQKIFEYAHSRGIKKVIFAHNRADVIETMMMNMFYSRKISTMMPKQPLFGGKIEVIRPFYEVPEILLKNFSKEIPSIKKSCEFDGNTKREYTKQLIEKISQEHPNIDIKGNLYNAILNVDGDFLPKK